MYPIITSSSDHHKSACFSFQGLFCIFLLVVRAMIADFPGLPELLWGYTRPTYWVKGACWARHSTWWGNDFWMAEPTNPKVVGTHFFKTECSRVPSPWICLSVASSGFSIVVFRSRYTSPHVTNLKNDKVRLRTRVLYLLIKMNDFAFSTEWLRGWGTTQSLRTRCWRQYGYGQAGYCCLAGCQRLNTRHSREWFTFSKPQQKQF